MTVNNDQRAQNSPVPEEPAKTLTLPDPPGWKTRWSFEELSVSYKIRNRVGGLLFNSFVTHIPIHWVRRNYLKFFGATIGEGTTFLRGLQVMDIDLLNIGSNCSIGFRVLFDARSGIAIGDNVVIASDTQFIAGGHDPNHKDFPPVFAPLQVGDYAWVATRATVLGGAHIGRGAVVGACACVTRPVNDLEMVAGVPAKVKSMRNPDALQYIPYYRPLFF
ncbi:acyltransferase [Williamsia maris]|uniref:Acetyltransferase (Isoleucine patch superfamily) n=1 Tax=Williamsia maris TaxID=72806 RepID=A0ABT1HI93_9NOCA|nr:acyltransferase [Williamsia maris]MCP2177091.1 Acetyltransferase (isoleucine patch superfamily) [Williamsia maris]